MDIVIIFISSCNKLFYMYHYMFYFSQCCLKYEIKDFTFITFIKQIKRLHSSYDKLDIC